jgi:hypothetical protein
LIFEALPIAFKEYPGESAVGIRKRTLRGKIPALYRRFKGLMMQMGVDQPRPGRDPRFHHRYDAAGPQTACCFPEERGHVGYVMEDIGHDDGAKITGREWQMSRISDELDPRTLEDFRGDYIGNKLLKEAGSRAELEDRAVAAREALKDRAIPVFVDRAEKGFRGDNRSPEFGGPGIVD